MGIMAARGGPGGGWCQWFVAFDCAYLWWKEWGAELGTEND
jgi:hypothetical protein